MKSFIIILCLSAFRSIAQEKDSLDVEKDLFDILRGNKQPRKSLQHQKMMQIYMPLFTTSPATGASFGLTGTGHWLTKEQKTKWMTN